MHSEYHFFSPCTLYTISASSFFFFVNNFLYPSFVLCEQLMNAAALLLSCSTLSALVCLFVTFLCSRIKRTWKKVICIINSHCVYCSNIKAQRIFSRTQISSANYDTFAKSTLHVFYSLHFFLLSMCFFCFRRFFLLFRIVLHLCDTDK